MSITTVRNILEKPGCVISVSAVLLLVMVVTSFYTCGPTGQDLQSQQQGESVAVTIGEQEITLAQFNERLEAQMSQFGGFGLPPDLQATLAGNILASQVEQAKMLELARSRGITIADEEAKQAAMAQIPRQLEEVKMTLVSQGKLKPNATEKEFNDVFTKEAGFDIATARKRTEEQIGQALQDPNRRPDLIASLVQERLLEAAAKQLNPTDEELRKTFDTYQFKRILVTAAGGGSPQQRAQQALAEVKAGLPFEKAMERYSNEPAQPKKKVSDNVISLTGRELQTMPAFAPLRTLKPGQTSEPLTLPEGVAIYKLISVKSEVPKDFDKNKAQHRQAYVQALARQRLDDELKGQGQEIKIEWKSPGMKVLYDLAASSRNAPQSPEERRKQLRAIVDEAKNALGDPIGDRYAALALHGAFNSLFTQATAEEKKAMAKERIEVLQAVLDQVENVQMHIDLAKALAEQNQKEPAFEHLLIAAQSNQSLDQEGQSNYNAIKEVLADWRAKKFADAEAEGQIEKVLFDWRKERAEKELAEKKARDEAEAERKKFEAEQKKQGGSPGGSAPVSRGEAQKQKGR